MKKTKTKAILVKISLLDQLKQVLGKVNKPVLVFVITLFFGIGIAIGLGYLYSFYHDKISATEGIRDTLTYQGKVVNADGVPPPDGNYNMQFKIFDSQSAGTLLWTEIWDGNAHTGQGTNSKVAVTQGVFTVELNSLCRNWVGDCSANGGVTFNADSFYLQVELDYDGNGTFEEVFAPRKRFTATPYSMNADKFDGRESSDFVLKSGATMTGELIAPKITDSSVIGYYQFNDNVKNSSTYADLDGSLQGNASLGSDLLFLDGTDSHVLVNDNALLSFGNGTIDGSFTFSAWINLNNPVNFPIISKGIYNSNAEYFFGTDIDGKLTVRIYDESVADCYIGRRYAASALSGNSWLHVTATYNGNSTAAGLKLYVNGEEVDDADSSVSCSYVAMENLASALYLGKYDVNYANGKVDEVKIQNRALTPVEVRSLYSTSRTKYLDVEEVTTLYLYLSAVDPVEQANESGNLYFDPVFNQIRSSSQIYIPDNLPASQDAAAAQDYTHFDDEHKILAYDFVNSSQGIIDVEGLHNGTPYGDALPINDGYYGYGYRFDNNGDYISLNYNDFPAVSAGSIEMWARFNEISNSQTNYLAYFFAGINASISLYKQGVSDLYVAVGDSGATDTGYDIPDFNWHHYVLTWQSSPSNSFQVYVDGVAQGTAGSFTSMTPPTDITFGGKPTADSSLNGTLDSVAIYDDALTADEIANHAHSAFGTLYVNDKLKNGIVETTLGDLIAIPSFDNDYNPNDPVNFAYTGTKLLSLGFSEGYGNKTYSKENNWDGLLNASIYGATWIKDGMFGHGMSFDGIDDYLEITKILYDERFEFGTNDFAIEFWINGSSLGNNDRKVISKRVGNVGYEIYYDSSSDSLRFFIGDGTNTVDSAATASHFSDGLWHHFLASFDRDGNASIFRDSNLFDMSSVDISSVSGSLTNDANLLIGKDSTGNYFNGKIDSIVFYNLNGVSQFNFFDAFARVNKSSDFLFTIGKNTPNGLGTLSVINQSDNGHGAIIGMRNTNNTANYPLAIWTDNNNSDIYNLIYFGSTILPSFSSTEYGNLKWDNANQRFLFNKGLDITGDVIASGTVSGALRAAGGSDPTSGGCTAGDFTWDSSYIYICTEADTWQKAPFETAP